MQLVKGMFGTEFNPTTRAFELRTGQMRAGGKVTHNSGWYNATGEKLGCPSPIPRVELVDSLAHDGNLDGQANPWRGVGRRCSPHPGCWM